MAGSNRKDTDNKKDRRKITELHEELPEYWSEDQWYQDEGDSGDGD